MQTLYFCPVIYIFYLLFYSLPNLSGCQLDVYHTSTHDVALCEFRMHVRNVLHTARWKYRTQKIAICAPSDMSLSGYIFVTEAHIDNRKNLIKQQYLLHMSLQYGELWPTNGWDPLASLGHPSKFQRVSRLCSVTARHSSSGRQSNFAALNRGRHLYSAGRPSRWALAHILVFGFCFCHW